MNLSLFLDCPEELQPVSFNALFDAWIHHRAQTKSRVRAERPLSEESIRVYREMWCAFAQYCTDRKLDFMTVEASDIDAFLKARSAGEGQGRSRVIPKGEALSARYAWRLLNLIDRLSHFHARREGVAANPAASDLLQREEYRYVNAANNVPAPEYYDEKQVCDLIVALTQADQIRLLRGAQQWKTMRDRTAVALMLGAGLTPGDVRVLDLHGVVCRGAAANDLPWKLALPANGNGPARETPLASWAAPLLADWLALRAEHGLAGTLVFPATAAGKPWSHTACHDACKATLAQAGFDDVHQGIFKLRHTYALRQLACGKSEADVAQWLGFLDIHSMARYRHILAYPVCVV